MGSICSCYSDNSKGDYVEQPQGMANWEAKVPQLRSLQESTEPIASFPTIDYEKENSENEDEDIFDGDKIDESEEKKLD